MIENFQKKIDAAARELELITSMTAAIDILGDLLEICQSTLIGITKCGDAKQHANTAQSTLAYMVSRKPDLDAANKRIEQAFMGGK